MVWYSIFDWEGVHESHGADNVSGSLFYYAQNLLNIREMLSSGIDFDNNKLHKIVYSIVKLNVNDDSL